MANYKVSISTKERRKKRGTKSKARKTKQENLFQYNQV
jgi:hypothetical protein